MSEYHTVQHGIRQVRALYQQELTFGNYSKIFSGQSSSRFPPDPPFLQRRNGKKKENQDDFSGYMRPLGLPKILMTLTSSMVYLRFYSRIWRTGVQITIRNARQLRVIKSSLFQSHFCGSGEPERRGAQQWKYKLKTVKPVPQLEFLQIIVQQPTLPTHTLGLLFADNEMEIGKIA